VTHGSASTVAVYTTAAYRDVNTAAYRDVNALTAAD
jgi:hypothetical protein